MTREDAIKLAHAPAPMNKLLRPHRNKVLCLMVEADSQVGSIVIPDVAKVQTGEAIVIDVGPGAWDEKENKFHPIPDLHVGDRVCIAKYMGSQTILDEVLIEDDGSERRVKRTYVTIHPDNILNKYA